MNIKDVHLSGGSHVVILGAGASIAAALRNPEKPGLSLPSMNDLLKVCGLDEVLSKFPEKLICDNFEATYSNFVEYDPNNHYLKVMNKMIYSFFRKLELPDEPTIYDYFFFFYLKPFVSIISTCRKNCTRNVLVDREEI